MQTENTAIHDVKIITPRLFGDERGFFLESYNKNRYSGVLGDCEFVQDNHSKSTKGVLRGLHFQNPKAQGKLVRVTSGAVYDVVVDIRPDSPTFKTYIGVELNGKEQKQLWVPPGLAHGFLTLEDDTEFLYKCTDFYHPDYEYSLLWNDSELNIQWPQLDVDYIISEKDKKGLTLQEILSIL